MVHARLKLARRAAAPLIALSMLVPAAAPVAAADPVVLTVGTTQDLDSTNPFNTYLVVGYEAFQLTYDLLTNFAQDTSPGPGFANSWERSPDKVTYHIRDGMKWSDGTPATSQDVCFSWGLAMAAIADDTNIGAGYLDPNLVDSGVTRIECPDDSTFVAYTTDQSDRIFQTYIPIMPKHVFGDIDYKQMAEEKFDAPLVGTGPYQLVEWKTGEYARFVRNPNYWGQQGFEDEVVIQFFPDNTDGMFQALKNGELDYAHNVNSDQFKQLQADPAYATVPGSANGWTQLAFNTYGTGTGKTIKNGGPSTKALLDPAFRDAIGYAVDRQALVDRVLGGFGDVGTTAVPPVLEQWHVTPDNLRTFDIELAKSKLDAAGYKLDGSGNRLDKEGQPIKLRLYAPDSDGNYAKVAEFIKDWYGQLGIVVSTQILTSAALGELVLPPPDAKAKYDIELWGWAGNPDPNALLQIFTCDAIGSTSDSQYCNPEYDKLYELQLTQSGDERHATLAQMQNLLYDEAPYDILFYDANLAAYRTDRFAGWQNMPDSGTPLFTYGDLGYSLLTDATAVASPEPTEPGATAAPVEPGATAAPATPAPDDGSASGSDSNSTLILGLGALIVIVIVGGLILSRRRKSTPDDDDE